MTLYVAWESKNPTCMEVGLLVSTKDCLSPNATEVAHGSPDAETDWSHTENSPRGTSDHVFKEQALTSIDLWQLHAARAQLVY